MYNLLQYGLILDTLYLENEHEDTTAKDALELHLGANVFIRKSDENVKKTCKDPTQLVHFKNHCGFDIDDGGWSLVRHAPNETTWHPSSDRLQGSEVYGVASKGPEGDEAWSIDFESTLPNYDEILIASGNCKNWLILDKGALTGNYEPKIWMFCSEYI